MISQNPLRIIGRDPIIESLLARLQRPDDVRDDYNHKVFRPTTGYYGLAGMGKSRLLDEVSQRVKRVTPYVVNIDFDSRAGAPIPRTPLELLIHVIKALEQKDSESLPFWQQLWRRVWRKRSVFEPCWEVIRSSGSINSINQTINVNRGEATGVSQEIDLAGLDEMVLSKLALPFKEALTNLHFKSATRREPEVFGKEKPRPLVVILLDTVDTAPRPLRSALLMLKNRFGGKETLTFCVLWILAGRQKLSNLIEEPLPPLSPNESAVFVREYLLNSLKSSQGKPDSTTQELLKDGPVLANITQYGMGIPLYLQLLANVAMLNPSAFKKLVTDLPDEHELRFRYVMEFYLNRLSEQASEQDDSVLWQSYFLLIYGAVPRRLTGSGLLRVLLQDLPGTSFDSRTNYEALFQELSREGFVSGSIDRGLVYHTLVREGTISYLEHTNPDLLHQVHYRAAEWFYQRNDLAEYLYHKIHSDYAKAVDELRDALSSAEATAKWSVVQSLIEITTSISLADKDQAWVTFYKASLAWAEKNPALAIERLRRLYGESGDLELSKKIADRIEQWLDLDVEIERSIRNAKNIQLSKDYAADLRYWAKQRNLPGTQAYGCLLLAEKGLEENVLEDVQTYASEAFNLCHIFQYKEGQGHATRLLIQLSIRQDRLEEANELAKTALELYKNVDDQLGQGCIKFALAQIACHRDLYDEAQALLDESLRCFITSDYTIGQAHVKRALGEIQAFIRKDTDINASTTLLKEALEIYTAEHFIIGQGNVMRLLAEIAYVRGKPEVAWEWYSEALKQYKEKGDKLYQAETLTYLGILESSYDLHKVKLHGLIAAELKLRQVLGLYEAGNERLNQANIKTMLAPILYAQNREEEAKGFLEWSLLLYREMGIQSGQASVLNVLAQIALMQPEYPEAMRLSEEALEISIKAKDQENYELAESFRDLATRKEALSLDDLISFRFVGIFRSIDRSGWGIRYERIRKESLKIVKIQVTRRLGETGGPLIG
jgi:hypothetical protein